jgi:hypothetical protein
MSHVDEKRQPEVIIDWCLPPMRSSSRIEGYSNSGRIVAKPDRTHFGVTSGLPVTGSRSHDPNRGILRIWSAVAITRLIWQSSNRVASYPVPAARPKN